MPAALCSRDVADSQETQFQIVQRPEASPQWVAVSTRYLHLSDLCVHPVSLPGPVPAAAGASPRTGRGRCAAGEEALLGQAHGQGTAPVTVLDRAPW